MRALHPRSRRARSEEHTSELQSHHDLVCRLLLEKKKTKDTGPPGKDDQTGYGIVRLLNVLTEDVPADAPNPVYEEVDRFLFFFFNDTATTEIYTLSLHDALPTSPVRAQVALSGPRLHLILQRSD